jgi:hypothetical protein
MALAYSKDFLVKAYLWRFRESEATDAQMLKLEDLAVNLYDEVGKDKFRTYASLTPEYLKLYKQALKTGESFLKLSSTYGTLLSSSE